MIDFTCELEGGDTYTVTAKARDVLIWEKTGRDRNFAELMSKLPLKDLYVIAHLASKRTGKFDGNLELFERTVDLTFEGAEEPDPTQPAH